MFFDFNRPSNAIKFITDDNDEFSLAPGATSVAATFDINPGTGEVQVDPSDSTDFFVCDDSGTLTVASFKLLETDDRFILDRCKILLKRAAPLRCSLPVSLGRSSTLSGVLLIPKRIQIRVYVLSRDRFI
jgi:hypothetical protein